MIPAFPRPASEDRRSGSLPDGDDHIAEQDGMSLRDYFAAHALIAYWSDPDVSASHTTAAEFAYAAADAMLTEREK